VQRAFQDAHGSLRRHDPGQREARAPQHVFPLHRRPLPATERGQYRQIQEFTRPRVVPRQDDVLDQEELRRSGHGSSQIGQNLSRVVVIPVVEDQLEKIAVTPSWEVAKQVSSHRLAAVREAVRR
jgi:hypothetical protein